MRPTWDFHIGHYRIKIWRYITFGYRPNLVRGFYGGPSNVWTWWKLWIEWESALPYTDRHGEQ